MIVKPSNIKLLANDGISVCNENSCSACLLQQPSLSTYPNGGVISVYWGQNLNEGILAVMQLWTWHSYRHLVMANLCKSTDNGCARLSDDSAKASRSCMLFPLKLFPFICWWSKANLVSVSVIKHFLTRIDFLSGKLHNTHVTIFLEANQAPGH